MKNQFELSEDNMTRERTPHRIDRFGTPNALFSMPNFMSLIYLVWANVSTQYFWITIAHILECCVDDY